MARRTHIDRLLDRRGITKKQHAKLKAEEEARKNEAEKAAAKIAQAVIDKAMRPNVELRGAPPIGEASPRTQGSASPSLED